MRTPHLSSLFLALTLFGAVSLEAAPRKALCSKRILAFARKVSHLEGVLKSNVDGKELAAYAERIGRQILGANGAVGAPPVGWSLGNDLTKGPMQALLAAIVEESLPGFAEFEFASDVFQNRLRGSVPTEGIVLVGLADGEFEDEARHWLGTHELADAFPRLLLGGTHSRVTKGMQALLTAVTLSPSLADHSDDFSRMELANVLLNNLDPNIFHIVLLGDFNIDGNSKWLAEIVDAQVNTGTKEIFITVPTNAVVAGPRGDYPQPSTSLASDFANRGPNAISDWARSVFQTQTPLRLSGAFAVPGGVDYALVTPDGAQIVVLRTDLK